MAWAVPEFSRNHVTRAGDKLATGQGTPAEITEAMKVLNNWRSSHAYPINTFQSTLRKKLRRAKVADSLVAQRLKRTPSIIAKLRRENGMQLARMNDIGGLRAIVPNLEVVRQLEKSYINSKFGHELLHTHDYIANPKESGYRSLHMVYRYVGQKVSTYDGLRIELQLRTRMQHAWAMAVETMGAFLNSPLKASEGPEEWLEFFELAGAAFAFFEGTQVHEKYQDLGRQGCYERMRVSAHNLRVRDKLNGYCHAAHVIHDKEIAYSYHLIVVDPSKSLIKVKSFARKDLELATNAYLEVEEEIQPGSPVQAVLVSAGTLNDLKSAYPSYFLDAREFVSYMNQI